MKANNNKYNFLLLFMMLFSITSFSGNPASHDIWNNLLSKYVDVEGKVDYNGIITEKNKLESYLHILSTSLPEESWGMENIMAYWINAYNAYTIKLIIDNYPLKSILDLKFDGNSAWDYPFITIGSEKKTLNYIEHEMLRKKYKDPRIHFVVNCASFSCPRLLNEAFTGEKLNDLLNKLTREHINSSIHQKISANKVEISQLFNWYKDDFTKEGTIIDFLNKYSKIKINEDAQVNFIDYNWSLNMKE